MLKVILVIFTVFTLTTALEGHNQNEGAIFAYLLDFVLGWLGRYTPQVPTFPLLTTTQVYADIQNTFFANKALGLKLANDYTQGFNPITLVNSNPLRETAAHTMGDYYLTCPTILFASYLQTQPAFSGMVWQYRLNSASLYSPVTASVWINASHVDDIYYVFGNPWDPNSPFPLAPWGLGDQLLSQQIMDIWTYFAKYGNVPTVGGNVWPPYGLNCNGQLSCVNLLYVEFSKVASNMGAIHGNEYNGNSMLNSNYISNCFNYWVQLFTQYANY